jgi:hypothetical protein
MASFIPILGLLGFWYVAQTNEQEEFTQELVENTSSVGLDNSNRVLEAATGNSLPPGIQGQTRQEGNFAHDIAPNYTPSGLPSYLAEAKHQYVSSIMDNIGPVETTQVGPGLGVNPQVPAYGGYQQLFRVKPTNVGAYKLTTLPGRSGHAADITGGKQPYIGRVNHKMAPKTAHLPTRLPLQGGRAQGQGGAATAMTNHGTFEKSKKTTHRSETGMRTDALTYGPGNKLVGAPALVQDPTRNKGDFNAFTTNHTNNPQPGIHSYISGHQLSAEAAAMQLRSGQGRVLTADELFNLGLKPSENRSKADRAGNAGRMNVRGNPLAQGGAVSSVRIDQSRVDGRTGTLNGSRSQQYTGPEFHNFNSYKGQQNPRATSDFLGTAQRQLKNNPLIN